MQRLSFCNAGSPNPSTFILVLNVSREKERVLKQNLHQIKVNFRHLNHAALAISALNDLQGVRRCMEVA